MFSGPTTKQSTVDIALNKTKSYPLRDYALVQWTETGNKHIWFLIETDAKEKRIRDRGIGGWWVSGCFRHSDLRQEEKHLGSNLNVGKKMALGKSTENSSKKKSTIHREKRLRLSKGWCPFPRKNQWVEGDGVKEARRGLDQARSCRIWSGVWILEFGSHLPMVSLWRM